MPKPSSNWKVKPHLINASKASNAALIQTVKNSRCDAIVASTIAPTTHSKWGGGRPARDVQKWVATMNNWFFWLIIGLISIVGGFLALFNPLAASIAVEQLAGWFFLIVGILQIISAFRQAGWGAAIWAGLIGLLGAFVGISLLQNPLSGVISLTMLVGILFAVVGIAKIIMAMRIRATRFFGLILISGIISLVLAIMIFANFPVSAVTVLGILLAVELISNGVSLVALSMTTRG